MNKCKLGDIAFSQTGPFGSQLHEEDYVKEGIPIVTVEHLGDIGFTTQNLPFVSEQDAERLSKYTLMEGDIVFSRVGAIDRCVFTKKEQEGWLFSGRCIRVRCDSSKVNSRYLSYYFKLPFFKKMMLNLSVGATMPSLNTHLMDNVELNLLDRKNQDKIATFMNNIDSKIENNNKIISELESLAKTIYDYWFLQFEFPNEDGKPYKSSGGKMVWNDELKREIPEGWKVKPLIECISKEKNALVDGPFGTQMKISEYVDFGVPIYEMEMLNGKFILDEDIKHYVTEEKYKQVCRSSVKNGDIVISKTGTLGLVGLVDSKYEKGVIVSRLAKISPNEKMIGKYPLLQYLKNLNDSGYWLQHSSGSTMPILNNTIIGNVPIVMPNTDLYSKYSNKVKALYMNIRNKQIQNQELVSLRDFLLPMLMNGQVTFKEDE